MTQSLTLSCTCGATEWTILNTSRGRHIKCYCIDCQSFARHLDAQDRYLENGGTEILQTAPANIKFEKGRENLGLLRLGPKGLFRWYCTCCQTPIANTLATPGFPFVGAIVAAHQDGIGPIKAHVNTKAAHSAVAQTGMAGAVFSMFGRAIGAKLKGQTRQTPFFDASNPVVSPVVISREERVAARNG